MSESAAASVRFDVVLGRCDSFRAEVYVRAIVPAGTVDAALTGTLTGPDCRLATTLPVTATIRPVPGDTPGLVLGRAILTEPAFWTPELPNLYRLCVGLAADGREISSVRQPVGLRRSGVRGRSFWLDGRRFVPRGLVSAGSVDDVATFRAAGLTAVVTDPSEAFLDRCDAEGLAVIAWLPDSVVGVDAASRRILAWSRHPAVFLAVLPDSLPGGTAAAVVADTQPLRGTLLAAIAVDGTQPPSPSPAGPDAVMVVLPGGGLPHPAWRAFEPAVPLVACRAEAFTDVSPSRRPCDVLQAALAGWGTAADPPAHDWAGYVSGPLP